MIPLSLAGWAIRHNVQPQALAELAQLLGTQARSLEPAPPIPMDAREAKTEAYSQSQVRLEAPRAGVYLWRNNVGVLEDRYGTPVRFGLANDSPALNKRLKSADLIGVRPVTITPAHVGYTIGQFVSRECKRPDWKWTGNEREVAQAEWAALITSLGGDAKFATGPGTL